jgi:hypothetical protein
MRKGQSSRKVVIFAVTLLLVTSALSGCTGNEDEGADPLMGIWYSDDSQNGYQFTDTKWSILEDGLPYEDGLAIDKVYSWSTNENVLTLSYSAKVPDYNDEEFTCDDGSTIPMYYVNDYEDDCENGEDEGVDPETLDLEWNITQSFTYNWKYEIVGDDVMFMGVLSIEYSDGGATQMSSLPEDKICGDDGECYAMIRSSALAGAQHATVLNGVDAPEWWADNTSDNDW